MKKYTQFIITASLSVVITVGTVYFISYAAPDTTNSYLQKSTDPNTAYSLNVAGPGGARIEKDLTVGGSVIAASFLYSSDQRLKQNIRKMSDASKIFQLTGVRFQWKKDGSESIGLIAQDVEKVFPELVSTNKTTGMKAVDYAKLVAPLIETVKTQQKEINELKARIDNLK